MTPASSQTSGRITEGLLPWRNAARFSQTSVGGGLPVASSSRRRLGQGSPLGLPPLGSLWEGWEHAMVQPS